MEENPAKRYVLLSIDATLQSMRARPGLVASPSLNCHRCTKEVTAQTA